MAVQTDTLRNGLRRRSTNAFHATRDCSRRSGSSSARLARPGEGAEWWVADIGVVVGWKSEVDKAVVVLKHLGIALDRRLPVFVDAALESHLSLLDLGGVWLLMVVEGLLFDAFHVLVVGLEPSVFEKRKVLENVVACMFADPCPMCVSRRCRGREKYKTENVLDIVINGLHHPLLGL